MSISVETLEILFGKTNADVVTIDGKFEKSFETFLQLVESSKITELILHTNLIEESDLLSKTLAKSLVKKLTISGVSQSAFSFLSDSKIIESLQITKSDGINEICRYLQSNKSLKDLILTGIGFGDEGASAISTLLSRNTTLQKLEIQNNKISMKGMTLILDTLNQSGIKELDFSENDIRGESLEAICLKVSEMKQLFFFYSNSSNKSSLSTPNGAVSGIF